MRILNHLAAGLGLALGFASVAHAEPGNNFGWTTLNLMVDPVVELNGVPPTLNLGSTAMNGNMLNASAGLCVYSNTPTHRYQVLVSSEHNFNLTSASSQIPYQAYWNGNTVYGGWLTGQQGSEMPGCGGYANAFGGSMGMPNAELLVSTWLWAPVAGSYSDTLYITIAPE